MGNHVDSHNSVFVMWRGRAGESMFEPSRLVAQHTLLRAHLFCWQTLKIIQLVTIDKRQLSHLEPCRAPCHPCRVSANRRWPPTSKRAACSDVVQPSARRPPPCPPARGYGSPRSRRTRRQPAACAQRPQWIATRKSSRGRSCSLQTIMLIHIIVCSSCGLLRADVLEYYEREEGLEILKLNTSEHFPSKHEGSGEKRGGWGRGTHQAV